MPIVVKDFSWEESEESVRITVPLKGVQPNRVDIFSTEQYIKVSYPPYLFECFLFEQVEDVRGKASVGNGAVVFSLIKKEAGLWSRLQALEIGDKEFMKRKRDEAIQRAHERATEETRIREQEKREQERYALRQQMKMEEDERNRIEAVKEQERQRATEAIEEFKQKQQLSERTSLRSLDSDDDDDDGNGNKHTNTLDETKETTMTPSDIININTTKTEKHSKNSFKSHKHSVRKQYRSKEKKDLFEPPLPAPREAGSIQVLFTPRAFKTAARESKAPEEQEWLKKVAEASRNKKSIKDNPDAIDMEEMNPLWLKDKGIGFFKAGNYVAAINAFTAAIVLDGEIPSLYSNRAACHLQLKQYQECVQDCTCALDFLTPPVQANMLSRCKAHVRRGTAYFQMYEYVYALKDYEDALKLDPQNNSLRVDAERIRNIIQGT